MRTFDLRAVVIASAGNAGLSFESFVSGHAFQGKPARPPAGVRKTSEKASTLTAGEAQQPFLLPTLSRRAGAGETGLAGQPARVIEGAALTPSQQTRYDAGAGLDQSIGIGGHQPAPRGREQLAPSDQQIASVLTCIRREWGHAATPVAPEEVLDMRGLTMARTQPWTDADLQQGRGGCGAPAGRGGQQ